MVAHPAGDDGRVVWLGPAVERAVLRCVKVLAGAAAELLDVVVLGAEAFCLRLCAVAGAKRSDIEHLLEPCRRNIATNLAAAGLATDLPDREFGVGAAARSSSLLACAPVSGQRGGVILHALEGLGKFPPEPVEASLREGVARRFGSARGSAKIGSNSF